ncbi:hypothetical protein V502_07172 [Pseudogymnoascus sp. VKM F-4520 (FW-2644)]|nr:hypothetical protein V502_07172 [Pseudogymnoascus sp. VKM F-4520 (FW-2644)]
METRALHLARRAPRIPRLSFPRHTPRHHSTNTPSTTSSAPEWPQAKPLGPYYESLLTHPLSSAFTADPHPPPPKTSPPKSAKEENIARARVVFGSRLAGPAERRAELASKSELVAGVWVPPRPEEPDNCCMSGCVNCVWDRFGEEVEEWAAARKRAERAVGREVGVDMKEGKEEARSVDDDGGGSETNWDDGLSGELFKGVPVGILEFMKQEKRLKERHAREGSSGG